MFSKQTNRISMEKRKNLQKRIEALPDGNLQDLDDFIAGLEKKSQKPLKQAILSFAGVWKDADEELISGLTSTLHERRSQAAH